MSVALSGAGNSHFYRQSGNPANTNAFTACFWVKRTADFSGLKYLVAFRPNPETTGHDWVVNDPTKAAYIPSLQANWATAQAVPDDPLALNVWTFMAMVGSGGNISIKYWDGESLVTETVGQTSFVPERAFFGTAQISSTNNTYVFTGLFAHVRMWNAVLSDVELVAERNSTSAVKTASLVSAHSMGGGSVANAMTGQTGTAFSAGGGLTYSADMPTIETFNGVIISGEAMMPSETPVDLSGRYNWVRNSGNLTTELWAKQGNEVLTTGAASPPGQGVGLTSSQRALIKVNTGGIYQALTGAPTGTEHIAWVVVRKVDTTGFVLRLTNTTFADGVQGHFNFDTKLWHQFNAFGTATSPGTAYREFPAGWVALGIRGIVSGTPVLEFYPIETPGTQIPAVNKHVDFAHAQYEKGGVMTRPKSTSAAVATRTWSTIQVAASATTVPVGQTGNVFAFVLGDNASSPWDQDGPVTFRATDPTKVSFSSSAPVYSDYTGVGSVGFTGLAVGTTNLIATFRDVDSLPVAITVEAESQETRWIEIYVEPGWEGTTGWHVGVYRKHATDRFSSERLFVASNQAFQAERAFDQSRMTVIVPGGVSVTPGEFVDVVLENDNVGGRAVDGPGMFTAKVL